RPWKAPAQLAQQLFRLVTQQDGTDAPAALTDHYLAQAGVTQGVADGFPTAALAVATRRHAEDVVGGLVQAPAGAEARVVQRVGDGVPLFQGLAQALRPLGGGVGSG